MIHKSTKYGKRLVTAVPAFWLLLFFAVPFLIVFKISFSWMQPVQPGYAPLFEWVEETGRLVASLNFANYVTVLQDPLYLGTFLYSVKVAAISTVLCLLVGFPMAYAIARSRPSTRNLLLMLIILPFWTSFLLRVYAWIGLLKTNGVINNTLLEAASDLGASPTTAFFRITLPLAMPGVVAGCLLVFIPAVGEFVIPSLLGRTDQLMIGTVLSAQFFGARNWPVASAVAIVLLLLLLLPILLFQRYQQRELEAAKR